MKIYKTTELFPSPEAADFCGIFADTKPLYPDYAERILDLESNRATTWRVGGNTWPLEALIGAVVEFGDSLEIIKPQE